MSDTRRFSPNQPIVDQKNLTPANWFRDFLLRVDQAVVNAAVNATWGSIGGSLSSQGDLVAELAGKATTAQGALADSAVQPGDNVSELVNDAGYLNALVYTPHTVRDEASDPYVVVAGDANTIVRMTAADADVTIPVGLTLNAGDELRIRFAGTGTPTLDTTGLTLNGFLPMLSQHIELLLRFVTTDVYDVVRFN